MPWIQPKKKKRWHQLWTIRVAMVVLILGSVVGRPAMRRYDRWIAKKSLEHAKDYQAKGDYRHAMLAVRQALNVNPNDPDAIRIGAQVSEAAGSPEAQKWRTRLASILPGDSENLLGWAMGAVEVGDWGMADRVIRMLKPADQASARYHEIMARLAARKNDMVEAEAHWTEAVRFDPSEDRFRLNLASIRLQSKDADARAGALGILNELSEKGAQTIAARRILIQHALAEGDASGANRLADALVASPQGSFNDKLMRLATLRLLKDPESASYLIELRDTARSNPSDLARLLGWMNENGLAMMAAEWSGAFPVQIVSRPPVCIPVAEAFGKSTEWARLRAMTQKGNWMEADYLRRAFLARAFERLGETEGGETEWKAGLDAALSSRDALHRLERLARVSMEWGWKDRTEEILWKMAGYDGSPHWALDALWAVSLGRGETRKLHQIGGIIAKARPRDMRSLNNYVFISLLTRTQEGNPHQAAEALYKTNSTNPAVVSSYALSLYQQGRPAEAVVAMKALKPKELRDPHVALYYGIALMAAGMAGEAEEYLELGSHWQLLPEERALVVMVTADAAKKAASPAGDSVYPLKKSPSPDAPKRRVGSSDGRR